MLKKELEKEREEQEKSLKRKEDAHSQKFQGLVGSEEAYRASTGEINEIYKELFSVCLELGDPIPVRF